MIQIEQLGEEDSAIPSRWRYQLVLQGQPVELPEGEISLGRSRSCTVPLKDPSVSRNHALLMVRAGEVTLRDLNSSNGTFVNGARLAAEVGVHDGDRLLFGETEAIVRIVPPPDHPSATMHVDLDSLFCASCKAPMQEQVSVCASCGARRGEVAAPPALAVPQPSAPALPFSGSGSRQAIAPPSAPVPPMPVVAVAQPPAISAPKPPVLGDVLPSITGFDDTSGRARVAKDSKLDDRSLSTAPRPLAPVASGSRAPRPPRPTPSRPLQVTLTAAGFWVRWAACLVDTVAISAIAVGASFAVGGPMSERGSLLSSIVWIGLGLAVPILGWGLFGTTPGKRLFGLYVGPTTGGVGIGVGRAILRWLGYLVSLALLGVGFLLIGISKDKRGLHDQIAGTMVGRKQ